LRLFDNNARASGAGRRAVPLPLLLRHQRSVPATF
jgi:hypothetical protein